MLFQHFVFPAGHLEANLYIMGDEPSERAVMIDAGVFDDSVADFALEADLKIEAILITHLHPDHIGELKEYLRAWNCRVIAPAKIPGVAETQLTLVREGDAVEAGPYVFRVFRTSGHTPESVSYYCEDAALCFVGDAIFAGAVGGTSNDDLHEEEIECLKRDILTLPPETELYSGHGPATTVAIEKAANPFLQPGFGRTG